mgnify:CR=1 FL=1
MGLIISINETVWARPYMISRAWRFLYIKLSFFCFLVGEERFELSRIAPYASETYAYTNSATRPEPVNLSIGALF